MEEHEVWAGTHRLVERAPSLADLASHRLELVGARRWRELGHPVPKEIAQTERPAAALTVSAELLLERVRASYDGSLMLLKGLEVALHYPDPALRPFADLDIYVPDVEAARRQLLTGGFIEVGDPGLYIDMHHARPLAWPGLGLAVELHYRPKWVPWIDGPSCSELLSLGVPSKTGVDGVLTLPDEHHAIFLAAHAWAHEPLGCARDLVDVALLTCQSESQELDRIAAAWGVERLWRTTASAVEAALGEGRAPWAFHSWSRNIPLMRERTVLETHLQRILAPFWALPPVLALRASFAALVSEVRPLPSETGSEKVARSFRALADAFRPRSAHNRAVEERPSGSAAPSEGQRSQV
jgi:hypothetical protein